MITYRGTYMRGTMEHVSKWDVTINKVEGVPSKFGKSGAHICVPKEWLKTTVVVVPKEARSKTVSSNFDSISGYHDIKNV